MIDYIRRYEIEKDSIELKDGKLIYCKVKPIFDRVETHADIPSGRPEGSCFLYDDYACQLHPGDVFYEIKLLEVNETSRRKGIGTQLVKAFFNQCHPDSVVLSAGITTEKLYDELCAKSDPNALIDYIYANQVKFWEKMGFTDVNHTTFYFEETVPMLWPKSAADEAKRSSDEFKAKNKLVAETDYFSRQQ